MFFGRVTGIRTEGDSYSSSTTTLPPYCLRKTKRSSLCLGAPPCVVLRKQVLSEALREEYLWRFCVSSFCLPSHLASDTKPEIESL